MHSTGYSLHNGRLAFAEEYAKRERLHWQDRPEECLLLCSTALKTLEVHSVFSGMLVIRFPVSMFWPGTSPTNFYKATENPSSNYTKNQHSVNRLHGQYALDDPNNKRTEHGK